MSATIPLRLAVDIKSPDGTTHNRWGPDEPNPADVPTALTFSTTMPGGFEQLNCTLARKPSVDYPDLGEFSTVTVYGVGGEVAWQGRLETTPRVTGDQISISPGAVGWQAALDDNQSAREIYIDIDLTRWGPESTQMKVNDQTAGNDVDDSSVSPDATTGQPALATQWTGPVTRGRIAKAWYDAKGLPLGAIYFAWTKGPGVDPAQPAFFWGVNLSTDDIQTTVDATSNLRATGPGTGTLTPTNTNRRFAYVYFWTNAAYGTAADFAIYWTYLGVQGLATSYPLHGTLTATGGLGVFASEVVTHAVSKYAPQLALTDTGGASTITPTAFIIPQVVYLDPTTAGNIVKDVLKYELQDWAVWEGPTFWMTPRNGRGNSWRARVGPSGLSETGPQVDRIYNGVIVNYTDVTGAARIAGPALDSDPANPATLAGLTRYFNMPSIGVSTAAAATQIGQAFLAEQKAISTAGQASILGVVQDSSGVTWPAWMIRAGDNITFVDAHDPVPRRIVKTSYNDDTKTNQIDLDSPPEGLQALLARLSITDTTLGF